MVIDSISNGVVIDHIIAGKSMEIYKYLGFDKLDCSIAIIKNVKSKKMEKKDIIKIENTIDLDLETLGFFGNNITINIIKDGKLAEKKTLSLPKKITNIVNCKNPRCITSTEPNIPQEFRLSGNNVYRCIYCEHAHGRDK